jgi:hypothetical protein
MKTNLKCFPSERYIALVAVALLVNVTMHAVNVKHMSIARTTRSANTAMNASLQMRNMQPDSAYLLHMSHRNIERELGISLSVERVVSILHAIACDVRIQSLADDCLYSIMPSSRRSAKDICSAQDILDEIAHVCELEGATIVRAPRPEGSNEPSLVSPFDSSLLADIAACCCNLTNTVGPNDKGICDASRWSTVDGIQNTNQSVIGWLKTIMIELRGLCQSMP